MSRSDDPSVLGEEGGIDPVGSFLRRAQRDLLFGAAALLPFVVLWALAAYLIDLLPLPAALADVRDTVMRDAPLLGVLIGLVGGCAVLWIAGRFASSAFGRGIERLPVLRFAYGAQRELLGVLEEQGVRPRPVVLVPSRVDEVLSVAIVTRTVKDKASGEEYAALYFLGSPNPVGGRAGLVPMASLIRTDWTPRDALRFVVSGGTVTPDRIRVDRPPVGG